MIKIIDGKRYNTDTAEEICDWTNGKFGKFEYREKTMFRTKKGNWFIYHYGGPMTDMAISAGMNSWSSSEDIEPVTEKQALDFLEKYNGYKAIEKYFPNQLQDA
ncbi:hypothetical protein AB3U99_01210 [Niallia sp. JL1B1071]|uniref:hypothetical protein n=1 Tax=Niallia tiangongensis TaxID=3237105 RepID=UPI0037DD0543